MTRFDLDIINYQSVLWITDMEQDLDISHSKWDFVFEFLKQNGRLAYFDGYRLDHNDDDYIKELIESSSESVLYNYHRVHHVFLKLKDSTLTNHRRVLTELWDCYDRPRVFFFQEEQEAQHIANRFSKPSNASARKQPIMTGIQHGYVLSRGMEENVMRIDKSDDAPPFPWETSRSKLALDRLANEGFLAKLLRKLHLSFDIRIKRL